MIKDRQHYVLLAGITCVIVGSTLGVWIDYPLSNSVRGLDWRMQDAIVWRNFLALPFLGFFIAALTLLLTGWKPIGSLLLSVAIVALLTVPALIWLLDSSWITTYINDIVQYEQIQFIVLFLGGTPNAGYGTYLKGVDSFQYLTDRAHITLDMLGWGWIISCIGILAVVWLLRRSGDLVSLHKTFWPAALGVIILGVTGSNTLRADLHYRAADQRLGLGDYNGALDDYVMALELDPFLAQSKTYLNNVSKAYYQLGGANDMRGQLYLANTSTNLSRESVNALLIASKTGSDGSNMGNALSEMAGRTESDTLIKNSLRAYKFGDLGTAAINLQRVLVANPHWRHARYFRAYVLGKLRAFDEADRELNDLLLTVDKDAIKAVIYNALGDVHSAAGHLDQAREYYARSYKLDKSSNLWAIKGLGGT